MNLLFGVPYYKGTIDSSLYNKKRIIEDITFNYEKSPFRNKWYYDSNLHHSFNDEDNLSFLKIDYSELYPLYEKEIYKFFNQIAFKNHIKFKIKIVNYTASKNDQYMNAHHHCPSLFYGIHYLSYDSQEHVPTTHISSHKFSGYTKLFYGKLLDSLDSEKIENSWVYETWKFDTVEDDFFIFPSLVEHRIDASHSDKLRITIAMNIDIDNS